METQHPKTAQFLWIDLEMTGLEPSIHKIIELALIITDEQFQPICTYETPVYQPPEVLERMDAWCVKTHGNSGLTDKIPSAPALSSVDMHVHGLLKKHFASAEKIILAGNSIGQDRKFIDTYMPLLSQSLHYRMVDVSSFKEIYSRCFKVRFNKQNNHRALEDISESIAELQYYLSFLNQEQSK